MNYKDTNENQEFEGTKETEKSLIAQEKGTTFKKKEQRSILEKAMGGLSVFTLLFLFLPAISINAAGDLFNDKISVNISVMNALKGVEFHGLQVVEPQLILSILFIWPISIIVLFFTKRFKQKSKYIAIAVCAIVDSVIWIITCMLIKELSSDMRLIADVSTTPWFVLNVLSIIVIAVIAIILSIREKRGVANNCVNYSYNDETSKDGNELLDNVSNVATIVADKAKEIPVDSYIKKFKNLPKKVLIAIACGIIACVFILGIFIKSRNTINLNQYITVEVKGYEGLGTANATIDWNAIDNKYGDKIKFSSKVNKKFKFMKPIDILQESIDGSLDKSTKLSNGDEITYMWNIDESVFEYITCKLKFDDKKIKVSDLKELDKFDAFKDLEVKFSGVSPTGNVKLDYKGEVLENGHFGCQQRNNLKNGDKVKVTLSDFSMNLVAQTHGKIPQEFEKEYTVEGLPSYLEKLSDIKEDELAKIQKQASDTYNAYIARDWTEGEALESMNYMGSYLLTPKNLAGNKNSLYLIYNIKVRNTFSNDQESYDQVNDVYWYIKYDNVILNSDGTLDINLTNYSLPYNDFEVDSKIKKSYTTMKWRYNGYSSLEELYKNTVLSRLDKYNIEENIKKDN